MRRTIVVLAIGGALAVIFSGSAPSAPSSSTLNLTARFVTDGIGRYTCPPGPAIECFQQSATTAVPGLGTTTMNATLLLDDPGPSGCPPGRLSGTLGAGTDSAAFAGTSDCVPANGAATFMYAFTGGSGAFAGASGTGQISHSFLTNSDQYVWSGTLIVPAHSFDTTPPTFSGIHGKTVHVRKQARRARVRYAVTAQDDVDGAVRASCHPASGAWFHLGRTTVRCHATDKHANEADASFRVTVRRAG